MRSLLLVAFCTAFVCANPAMAQQREAIGEGRLFSNDYLGDGHDRWRTGSYVFSHLRGSEPYDGQIVNSGDIIEYRLRAELIAPQSGNDGSGIRPYVGALSLGAHSHFDVEGAHGTLGADVTAIGPQTRLDDLQNGFHDAFSLPQVAQDTQLGDAFYLTVSGSLTHKVQLADHVTFRPFAEALIGVEDIVRVGGDVMIGTVGQDDLMLRDVVTGQLYRGTSSLGSGPSLMLGADVAAVGDSAFLSEGDGYVASDTRARARAGVHYQVSDDMSFFYGMTYLSEEFEGQPEGQVLGSLKLNFNF